ncbi:MAG: hypothetical protein ACI9R3_001848 [Verrucomicrobiales bacterium]|jgi:hypothetical protein
MYAFRLALCIFSSTFLFGCGDTVTSRYESRAEAESDQLFQRGWLPDIIPESSADIVTKNDLDQNTSQGEFSFSRADLPIFLTHLNLVEDSEEAGYAAYTFKEWTFLIDQKNLHCRYHHKLTR